MLPLVWPGRCTTWTGKAKGMTSPSSSATSTLVGVPFSLSMTGRARCAISLFWKGLGWSSQPEMMPASRGWAMTGMSRPAMSSAAPAAWSGWRWVMMRALTASMVRPMASRPPRMSGELPLMPASMRSASPLAVRASSPAVRASPLAVRTVTLAPRALSWKTPSAMRIGLPSFTGLPPRGAMCGGGALRVCVGHGAGPRRTVIP